MKNSQFVILTSLLFIVHPFQGNGQAFEIRKVATSTASHFRAASVIDERTAWVSGSLGTFGRSLDGGKTWKFSQVKNFEKLEFRSLFAFDSLKAVIANAGSPAYVLHTKDGGRNWNVVYTSTHQDAFIDGMDFWNDYEGVIYGDAMEGHMLLLRSNNGGLNWSAPAKESRPALKEGEGSFAASGTGIRCFGNKDLLIATGGKTSRLWISHDRALSWSVLNPPILQGETMTGIFSVASLDALRWIIVGGNYEKDSLKIAHIFYTTDAGKYWKQPAAPTRGLRECVEFIGNGVVISSGLNGVDVSYDDGQAWQPLSDERQFSVVRRARKGSLVILAGANGKIALLEKRP